MTPLVPEAPIIIPAWVKDQATYRRWAKSAAFPEHGKICYLDGELWIDMSPARIFPHNAVKGEFYRALGNLVKEEDPGQFFPDQTLLTNLEAALSCEPDGVFILWESITGDRARFTDRAEDCVEVEGTVDMVLEIVSPSSVRKDTETLRDLYWRAGITEYWLVDARGDPLRFDILKHGPRGYTATRKQGGWLPSKVFGKAFRLTRQTDRLGHWRFTLEYR